MRAPDRLAIPVEDPDNENSAASTTWHRGCFIRAAMDKNTNDDMQTLTRCRPLPSATGARATILKVVGRQHGAGAFQIELSNRFLPPEERSAAGGRAPLPVPAWGMARRPVGYVWK